MKYSSLPDLTAMTPGEVERICGALCIEAVFNDLSNGRYDYPLKRVIRYKTETKESGEVLVCDITGFPTLNYEQKNWKAANIKTLKA